MRLTDRFSPVMSSQNNYFWANWSWTDGILKPFLFSACAACIWFDPKLLSNGAEMVEQCESTWWRSNHNWRVVLLLRKRRHAHEFWHRISKYWEEWVRVILPFWVDLHHVKSLHRLFMIVACTPHSLSGSPHKFFLISTAKKRIGANLFFKCLSNDQWCCSEHRTQLAKEISALGRCSSLCNVNYHYISKQMRSANLLHYAICKRW